MEDYNQHVVNEKKELDARIEKLRKFNDSRFSQEERDRLSRQLISMGMYSDILGERIDAFDDY